MTSYESVFDFPVRRDVAGMSERLGTVSAGQTITVGLDSPRYGPYLVQGGAYLTSGDELILAGVSIGAKLASKSGTQVRQPSKEMRIVSLEALPDLLGTRIAVQDLGHGDLVSAEFEQHPYGRFRIVGIVTGQESSENLTLGPWFLKDDLGKAPRVIETLKVMNAGDHILKVPVLRITNLSVEDD